MFYENNVFENDFQRQSSINLQQNSPRQSSPSPDLTLLFSLTLITTVIMTLALSSLPSQRLENHPMCGVTTGGKDECYFDCEVVSCVEETDVIIEDLSCIQGCFEDTPDNCVTALLKDVINNGVCYEFQETQIYPFNANCDIDIVTYDDEEYPDYPDVESIIKGTCSEETERLLNTTECLNIIFEQPEFIINTINTLIAFSCNQNTSLAIFFFLEDNNLGVGRSITSSDRPINKTRLAPAQFILEAENIRTELQYENTRNRYPWVCSLRSLGPTPEHRCAVNLLSVPPSPTVVVGAAHCTYICKDNTREVPVCCCSDGTDDCRDTDKRCGDNPGVVKMTSSDSTIVCGEWDTSGAMSLSSQERYNVKLPILEIIRHPDFDPAKGPQTGSDIVVFKVDDSSIRDGVGKTLELWPACLPSQTMEVPKTGIQTGWSQPPPFLFVQNQASGFAPFYNDFYKQWHYKMDIFPTCEDPTKSGLCGATLTYPSNSSYPAGTVCAKDFTRQSCFSTGDSGSPLMVQYGDNQDKNYIEGILSFVKGCDQFQFTKVDDGFANPAFILRQKSENPTTYTKLSCFLPWIAAQYNMVYESTGPLDPACSRDSGDPKDGKTTCRNTHSNWDELRDDIEAECIFPFYYKGQRYDECILFNEEDFLYPVFRCPIRNITTTINGISSFNVSIGDSYCLSDENDPLSTLDPDKSCGGFLNERPPFSQCKNNCPGVRALGIIGGGAILAGVGTLGALSSFVPVLGVGALGAAGVGGMMVAESVCAPPFFCTAPSGQCCRIVFGINGPICPEAC